MENTIWFKEKNSGRRKGKISFCKECNEEFIQRLSGKKEFCSRECKGKNRREREIVRCANCNKELERTLSRLKKAKHGFYFCDRKCKEEAQKLGGKCPEIRPSHFGTSVNDREKYRKWINGQENPLIKEIFESIPNIQQEGFNKLSEIAKIAQDLNYDNVLFHIHNILSDIEKRSRKSEARSQI